MTGQDRVLLITGASSGIGEVTARHAAQAGYRVALLARSRGRLERLAEALGGAERALSVPCDVTDAQATARAVDAVLDHFGQLDAVYANAGVGDGPGGFSDGDPTVWRELVLTNVYGVAVTLRHTLEALRDRRGHVLLTGSAAGRFTIPGSLYAATKWAVTAVGHNLREELRGSGVRVTLIEPGFVNTPFFDAPKPQALQPEDVARAVLYALAQPEHVDLNELLIRPTPPLA